MTAKPTSKSLLLASLGILGVLAGACESAPSSSDSNNPALGSNEAAFPTGCFYGEPDIHVVGRKVMASCPDGGDGIVVVCSGEPTKPKFLDDGRLVVSCSDGKTPEASPGAPLPQHQEP